MSPRIFPTGATLHDAAQSWKGYVLHGAPDRRTHLVDLEGNEVHSWQHLGFPSELIDPAVNGGKRGHVLVQLERSADGGRFNGIFDNRSIGELDWEANVVWKWSGGAASSSARPPTTSSGSRTATRCCSPPSPHGSRASRRPRWSIK